MVTMNSTVRILFPFPHAASRGSDHVPGSSRPVALLPDLPHAHKVGRILVFRLVFFAPMRTFTSIIGAVVHETGDPLAV